MGDLLSSIGNAIVNLCTFVVDFFGDLVYMIKLTGKFLVAVPGYLSWLPSGLVASIMTIFAIVVIYKILGREG